MKGLGRERKKERKKNYASGVRVLKLKLNGLMYSKIIQLAFGYTVHHYIMSLYLQMH